MSPKHRKDVSQLVEKYKRELPYLERPLLRRLIRVENPQLFKNNPSMASNLKTLDRHLKKAFETKKPSFQTEEKLSKPSRLNIFEYLKWKKQDEYEKLDECLRLAYCNSAIHREEMYLDDDDPEYLKKISEIEFKWRKKYGLV